MSTVAGSGAFGGVDGVGTLAVFNNPGWIALDSEGNAFITDNGNNLVRFISTLGVVSTLAGTLGTSGVTDGTGTTALFTGGTGPAVDSQGNLFVAHSSNSAIRKVAPSGVVTTLFQESNCIFNALTFSADYLLFASENSVISTITTSGTITRTIFVGNTGTQGHSDGEGTQAAFSSPEGLSFNTAGTLYVADTFNYCVRQITATGRPSLLRF
jgi:sugar lactone lactonase YvrE